MIVEKDNQIIARKYRNRRIGDFLKELKLTEGRGTGFPAVYRALESNGSPKPVFETDDASYVLVTLHIHPEFLNSDQANDQAKAFIFNSIDDIVNYTRVESNQARNQARNQAKSLVNEAIHEKVVVILRYISDWKSRKQILSHIGYKNHTDNRKRFLDPLVETGWIEIRYPDNPTHPNQGYKITEAGKRLLKLIS